MGEEKIVPEMLGLFVACYFLIWLWLFFSDGWERNRKGAETLESPIELLPNAARKKHWCSPEAAI